MYEVTKTSDRMTQDGVRIICADTCNSVCSRQVAVAVKDGVIVDCAFNGGCSGNTQGVARLVKGMSVDEAIARLDGILCGNRGTSCPDQLARTLRLFSK